MKSAKNLCCIRNVSFSGQRSLSTAKVVLSICALVSVLTLLIIHLKVTRDKGSLKLIKTITPQLSRKVDTLGELTSAGWNCIVISGRKKKINKPSFYRYDRYDSQHQLDRTHFLVPNVVHYVWLGNDLNFTFVHYLSFLNVHRFIIPTYVFVYGESGPTGYWWNRTVEEVDNLVLVNSVAKTHAPSGKPFAHKAHASDVLRTEIIFKFGGIYLDTDVIVLKSFDPLRRHRTVMGREVSIGLCNGILISAKGAPFIRMLLEQYDSYAGKSEVWAYRSVFVPNILAGVFPSLIHVEETSLHRPNWQEIELIYDSTYDWADNYAVHLWLRVQVKKNERKIPRSVEDIRCANTTIGEIGRHVYFGSKQQFSQFC